MLTVLRCDNLLGAERTQGMRVVWHDGITVGDVVRQVRDPLWGDIDVVAVVEGQARDVSCVLEDGAVVCVGPRIHGGFFFSIALIALSFGASYLAASLVEVPQPKQPQDESSPTFNFGGAQSTFGDGRFTTLIGGDTVVAGHVIGQNVEPLVQLPGVRTGSLESLNALVELGWGPIRSVGGVDRATDLEPASDPNLVSLPNPLFPANTRANGVTLTDASGAVGSVRLGEIYQTPMAGGFDLPTATVAVGEQLASKNDSFTVFVPSEQTRVIRVQIDVPQLFQQTDAGDYLPLTIEFTIRWRPRPDTTWSASRRLTISAMSRTPFSRPFEFDVDNAQPAPGFDGYEVQVQRVSDDNDSSGGSFFADTAIFQRVVYKAGFGQSYPGIALCGLRVPATVDINGGNPTFRIPVQGHLMRVYDDALGLSEETYYDLPDASDPYGGIWTNVPPGRNPAWQAIYLHTSEEGLEQMRYEPIYELYRNWADFCDANNLFSQFVLDNGGRQAWEALVQSVYQAGRAIPVRSGNRVFPIYWFRDAHGRGSNFVPAKVPMAVISASNCQQWTVSYKATGRLENVLTAQIRDAEADFELTPVSLIDPEVNTTDPSKLDFQPRRERELTLESVSDRRQALRHLWWMLQTSKRSDRDLEVVCGIDQVYFGLGQLFVFHADDYKPIPDTAIWHSARIREDVTDSTTFTINRELTVAQAGDYGVAIQSENTTTRTLVSLQAGAYAPGDPITVSLGNTVSLKKDAVIVFGAREEGTPDASDPPPAGQQFLCVGYTLMSEFRVKLNAILWAPEAYDEPPSEVLTGQSSGDPGMRPFPGVYFPDALAQLAGEQVSLQRQEDGRHRVSWVQPAGYAVRRSRVFVASANTDERLLGSTDQQQLDTDELPEDTVELRVVPFLEEAGRFAPTTVTSSLHVPEFVNLPMPTPGELAASLAADGVVLTWSEIADAEFYEVRRGSVVDGAEVVAITRERRVELRELPSGPRDYRVRAKRRFGGFSVEAVVSVDWAPSGGVSFDSVDVSGVELALVQMDVEDETAELSAGQLWGTASASLAIGKPLSALWTAEVDYRERMPGLVAGHPLFDVPLDQGEQYWRSALTREPSSRYPGYDLDILFADLPMSLPPATNAAKGVGRNTLVRLECRWDVVGDGATWSAWERFRPQRKKAAQMELRAVAIRASEDYQIGIERLRAEVRT